ncbi:uncharacterized protein E0L32_008189 [Thyridium curvatum]|uniref:25S rRNA adenine-N(1) methyltransferase n=1 Tax=Thyridium curvatum TaxID=1093900 RepID=A0A507B2L8_9PEZI|nr:uncharacterized protein E0L32_008189 [Thyridium curvatum]TPX10800.1 hypothetical protein E0L32_008189 [Thyridium curvatum]
MATKKKRSASKNLAATRPPITQKPKSITRKHTKALINSHHQLEKQKRQAVANGDASAAADIDRQLAALGGLKSYQQASLQGQRKDRGGDSSSVLMEWLKAEVPGLKARPLRMLEVGALSTENACSRSECFTIERIDLHSQGEGILEQDFMKRPLPGGDSERFDIISLSLVLNFVPNHQDRGDMLLRTLDFLVDPSPPSSSSPTKSSFPSLFLVLPAPCVTNSRYLDEDKLQAIMRCLGYEQVQYKSTQRLVYYLWKRVQQKPTKLPVFAKRGLRPGASRNNFAIALRGI